MKCEKCKAELKIERIGHYLSENYNMIELVYCPSCKDLQEIGVSMTNEEDLRLWASGAGSNMSVGIDD